MARRSRSVESNTESLLFFYSVIFIHRLEIIRNEYVVCLQFFATAILPYIIKISQHFTEQLQKQTNELFLRHSVCAYLKVSQCLQMICSQPGPKFADIVLRFILGYVIRSP